VEQALVQAAVTGPARQNADVQAMQRVTDKRPVPTDATIAAFLIEFCSEFSAPLIWNSSTTRCHTLEASFHSIQQFTLVYHTRRKWFILLDLHFGALHSR
jgi:hypothetical protein